MPPALKGVENWNLKILNQLKVLHFWCDHPFCKWLHHFCKFCLSFNITVVSIIIIIIGLLLSDCSGFYQTQLYTANQMGLKETKHQTIPLAYLVEGNKYSHIGQCMSGLETVQIEMQAIWKICPSSFHGNQTLRGNHKKSCESSTCQKLSEKTNKPTNWWSNNSLDSGQFV